MMCLLKHIAVSIIFMVGSVSICQTKFACSPGWQGQILIDCDSLNNWANPPETSTGSFGNMELTAGIIDGAVRMNWTLGPDSTAYVQARYDFKPAVDLSPYDVFGLCLRGSNGYKNRISIMFADTFNVFYGIDWEGINTISLWMKNLVIPKKQFHLFWGPDTSINWSKINRMFFVIKRPNSQKHLGGSGELTIDNVQAGIASEWERQTDFDTVQTDTSAKRKAVRYILDMQKNSGLFASWKEQLPRVSWLYDQALVLIVLSREGIWNDGIPQNEAAIKAKALVDFITSQQNNDGHWPRGWISDSGEVTSDDKWIGDQSWWIIALSQYVLKSNDTLASSSALKGADWLAPKINSEGKIDPSTEANVDTWWAMIATKRTDDANKIKNYLLTKVWDADLEYWWRGLANNNHPDPVVAMDCATWVGEFAKSKYVNKPEMAESALSFVRRTLVTTDSSGNLCGFDGMGPVSIWCEGTAQYISAGGKDAQIFLDILLTLQREDGGMPGSTDDVDSGDFGWLSNWTGLAPTAWLYFALTSTPFLPDTTKTSVSLEPGQIPNNFILFQNYPNPFNPVTKIKYTIPNITTNHSGKARQATASQHVILRVYDVLGREIKPLVNEIKTPGTYDAVFDGSGMASGVYFYKLNLGNFSQTKKMLLLE